MIWLKVPSSGTLIRGCSPLTCPDSKVRNGGGGVEARSCLDWDQRLSLVSKLFRGSLGWEGFSLTVLLLSTFEKAGRVLLLSAPGDEEPETESDPWREWVGGGRWGGGPMSAVSIPLLLAATPSSPLSGLQPAFPLLLCSPHPTPLLSIMPTGTPSPHERLHRRSNKVLEPPFSEHVSLKTAR